MKRTFGLLGLLGALRLALACNTADPGAGSNTNWLRPCDEDAECGSELSCLCGVCSAPCEDECGLADAVCARPGSAGLEQLCGDAEVAPEAGLCLPACAGDSECAPGQLCHDGGCLQLADTGGGDPSCLPGAELELSADGLELAARQGTLFGDALYLPVDYDERPSDWVEPMTPLPLVARVVDRDGAPLEGCRVQLLAGQDSGSAFADRQSTNADGEVTAYWVAGAGREQSLTAALVDADGRVASARLAATGYANDEGPRHDGEAATESARAATVWLGYGLPAPADAMRVRLRAESFPHHAFYAALSLDGFFAGLQNTSELDALAENVPDEERVLIASVWHVEGIEAELLFQAPDLECGPHEQELGGIRCTRPAAWLPGSEYLFTLERISLLPGEVGAGYAELGYATTECAGVDGCTDYTLYFAAADEPEVMQRVVAYRYQAATSGTSFGSFVQPYLEVAGQNSCLSAPRYEATFVPYAMLDGGFERIVEADFSATYRTWHNEVCANYGAAAARDGFRLVSGGPVILDRPKLPGDPARTLSLP